MAGGGNFFAHQVSNAPVRWLLSLTSCVLLSAALSSAAQAPAARSWDQITSAMKQRLTGIRRCYEPALIGRAPPGTHGRLLLRIDIDSAGHVRDIRPDRRGSDAQMLRVQWLVECLVEQVAQVRFGPGSPQTITFPLVFEPAQ